MDGFSAPTVNQRLLVAGLALVGCRTAGKPEPTVDPAATKTEQPKVSHEEIMQVVAGAESTCVRTQSGRVACLGGGMTYSELEYGLDTHVPQVIDVPPSKDISAGVGFACSLDRDGGRVRCWGSNAWGQLGRPTPSPSDHWPLPVPDLQDVEAIDSLAGFTCARREREAICWPGAKDQPSIRFEISPDHPEPRLEVRFLSDDDDDKFGVADGFARLFYGGHEFEQSPSYMSGGLGDDDAYRPWTRGTSMFREDRWCGATGDGFDCGGTEFAAQPGIEVGMNHGCAPVDGGVRCWGSNRAGQAPPELLPFGGRPKDVAVGAEHSCVVTRAGNVLCWGASGRGQIGLVPASGREPQVVAENAARAWAFPAATCYTTQSGEFRCAGNGQDYCAVPAFTSVRGLTNVSAMFMGPTGDPCAVDPNGDVWCGPGETWAKAISGGSPSRSEYTGFWLEDSGTDRKAVCWLEDGRGQCAPWETRGYELPSDPSRALGPRELPFGTRSDLVALQAVDDCLCALTSAGELICTTKTSQPDWAPLSHELPRGRVASLGNEAVVMADGSAYVLSPDRDRGGAERTVRAWETSRDQRVPIRRASDSCLLNEDGQITCDSKKTFVAAGKTFESLATSSSVTPNWKHACAIDEDHNLWCWGDGGSGELGDGQPICSTTPRDLSSAFYGAFAEAR